MTEPNYTDAQIESALDTKLGLDRTLRKLIRGDTVAIGYAKTDVVRALLDALSERQAAMQGQGGAVAQFEHHPNPAMDYCIEVESLLGEIENRRIGFENGTLSQTELDLRIERAMRFRVGGDEHAVRAKQLFRAALQPPQPVRSVSDEDVRSALKAMDDKSHTLRIQEGWKDYMDTDFESMRAALEHFAAIAQEKQS